ncbi:MAG: DegT/DnrJ/EryC1/StrS family aminotransferase, partial [Candidatus Micrarchaeia archaeon]
GYITEGLVTKEFENDVAAYVGCNHAIALTSCSAALEIALRVLDVGPGDEIIAPDFTYPITAGVAFLVGAKPVLVDVKLDDYKIDFAEVEKAITPKTKAVLPVLIFGNPVDIKPLRELQEKHGFAIIEDAACPRVQLSKIEKIIVERQRKARIYDELLSPYSRWLSTPFKKPGYKYNYQSYCIYLKIPKIRDQLIAEMKHFGIETQIGTFCPHLQPVFKNTRRIGDCQNAVKAFENILTLPMAPQITEEDQKYVVEKLVELLRKRA